MPVISAKVIKKPSKLRFCEGHGLHALIPQKTPCLRLFGSGHTGDPPYAMYMCMDCAEKSSEPKIRQALKGGQDAIVGSFAQFVILTTHDESSKGDK